MREKVELKRVLMEVFGGCNYTCQMCPQSTPGRDTSFKRKMPLKDFEKILDKIVRNHLYVDQHIYMLTCIFFYSIKVL